MFFCPSLPNQFTFVEKKVNRSRLINKMKKKNLKKINYTKNFIYVICFYTIFSKKKGFFENRKLTSGIPKS